MSRNPVVAVSSRVRCPRCRRFTFRSTPCKCGGAKPAYYEPEVDGTLGSAAERSGGGPAFVSMDESNQVRVSHPKEWVNLGEPYTAIPKGGA